MSVHLVLVPRPPLLRHPGRDARWGRLVLIGIGLLILVDLLIQILTTWRAGVNVAGN
ncbi:hypothetical protein ACFWYW_10340 [Nonomuraea sp. NPDC059023]|uniref:hypothetical protein n=1 Tax=unclassified Nonomuraea TaxID=2593643 RepID=UPI00367E5B9D